MARDPAQRHRVPAIGTIQCQRGVHLQANLGKTARMSTLFPQRRFFITEIIREKILLNYQQEIPYSVQVEVESYEETEHRIHIRSIIYVARESQKAIIIGKGGSAIKKLGMQARADIEEFTGKKIFLELFVKVDKDWRDNEAELKRFGYEA